ncbi:hypothetical protein GOODEAATRI_003046 [Goodea atripinnis]|uniref:Uncharacterized protein n=1 Tax=Goodea atripinnis TaxID=208336 RepID=A0ABV0NH38_9TELE
MPPYQTVLEEEVSNLASLGSDASQPPQTIPTLIPSLQRGKTIRTPGYIRKELLGGGNEGSSRQHIKLAPSKLTLAVAAILHAVYPTPQAWRQIGVYIGFSPSSLSAG